MNGSFYLQTYLRVIIDKTIAYSMMVLKILKMQVTIKRSIALSRLDAAAGAPALREGEKIKKKSSITNDSLNIVEYIDDNKEEDDQEGHSAWHNL